MASDINQVTVIGRLTRDAELKYSNGGLPIVKGSIASGYRRKSGDEWVDETNFFDFDLIGKRAEAIHKYLAKGKQLAIAGELRQERWEKDGQKRSKVTIKVNEIQLIGGKSDSAPRNADAVSEKPLGSQPGDGEFSGSDFESDVPF
jgi:single-strand DNA-binding protein